jgi:DNA-binding transcriptional LysR family regulator
VDLEVMRTFQRLAKWKNIYKAADDLFISQSTVISRIRVLEEEMGCEFFARKGRGIELTENGQKLENCVNRVLALLDEGVARIRSSKLGGRQLPIASVTNVISYILPELLSRFRKAMPEAEISLINSSTSAIVDMVSSGKVEIGLVRGPFQHKGVESETIHRDPLVAVVSSMHPWAGREMIKAEEFRRESILAFDRKTSAWSAVMEWFKQNDLCPRVAMEVDHIETTKQMVLQHPVIAFVPHITVRKEIEQGQLWEIKTEPALHIYRETVAIRHRSKPLTMQGKVFWQLLLHGPDNL